MRKFILNVHLYGGLICAPYLIIFGFSSLHYNHHFGFVSTPQKPEQWQAELTIEPVSDNEAFASSVRDSLGLMGWPVAWRMKRDAAGDLEFGLERPGKSYTIRTVAKERKVRIEEKPKSVWQVINSLHGLHGVPNSRLVPLWAVYTEVCTCFVVFAGLSGLYLWWTSKRERKAGLIAFGTAVLFSAGLMVFVILRG
jgi:hypothetical protein